jgi:hypothetical protein
MWRDRSLQAHFSFAQKTGIDIFFKRAILGTSTAERVGFKNSSQSEVG